MIEVMILSSYAVIPAAVIGLLALAGVPGLRW